MLDLRELRTSRLGAVWVQYSEDSRLVLIGPVFIGPLVDCAEYIANGTTDDPDGPGRETLYIDVLTTRDLEDYVASELVDTDPDTLAYYRALIAGTDTNL